MAGLECPKDSKHRVMLVEYNWKDLNHYDGISEIKCFDCGKRYGRWSKRELAEGESEPRFGIQGFTKQTVEIGNGSKEKPV